MSLGGNVGVQNGGREWSLGEGEGGRRREGLRGAMSRNGSEILFAGVSMGGRERDREQASL